jgi:Fe-S cluster biogenesis protein NfuA
MKMGIERVLKENFSNLGPVVNVEEAVSESVDVLTKEAVDLALEKVLPAVKGMGGSVEVASVNSSTGVVKLLFTGPPRLKTGIELVVKDVKFVKEVQFDALS